MYGIFGLTIVPVVYYFEGGSAGEAARAARAKRTARVAQSTHPATHDASSDGVTGVLSNAMESAVELLVHGSRSRRGTEQGDAGQRERDDEESKRKKKAMGRPATIIGYVAALSIAFTLMMGWWTYRDLSAGSVADALGGGATGASGAGMYPSSMSGTMRPPKGGGGGGGGGQAGVLLGALSSHSYDDKYYSSMVMRFKNNSLSWSTVGTTVGTTVGAVAGSVAGSVASRVNFFAKKGKGDHGGGQGGLLKGRIDGAAVSLNDTIDMATDEGGSPSASDTRRGDDDIAIESDSAASLKAPETFDTFDAFGASGLSGMSGGESGHSSGSYHFYWGYIVLLFVPQIFALTRDGVAEASSGPLQYSFAYLFFFVVVVCRLPDYLGHIALHYFNQMEHEAHESISGTGTGLTKFAVSLGFMGVMQGFFAIMRVVTERMAEKGAFPQFRFIGQLYFYYFWYLLMGGTSALNYTFWLMLWVQNLHYILTNTGVYAELLETLQVRAKLDCVSLYTMLKREPTCRCMHTRVLEN